MPESLTRGIGQSPFPNNRFCEAIGGIGNLQQNEQPNLELNPPGDSRAVGKRQAGQAKQQEQQQQRVMRRKRPHMLAEATAVAAAAAAVPDSAAWANDYERQRAERIRRNQAMLAELGILQATSDLDAATRVAGVTSTSANRRAAPLRQPRAPRPPVMPAQPPRQSARLRPGCAKGDAAPSEVPAGPAAPDPAAEEQEYQLLELEEYYKLAGIDYSSAVIVDDRLFYGCAKTVPHHPGSLLFSCSHLCTICSLMCVPPSLL